MKLEECDNKKTLKVMSKKIDKVVEKRRGVAWRGV